MIHVVTDGDEDLEHYRKDIFPKARHTLDIVHVLEYFWEAVRMQFEKGSDELTARVKKQERRTSRPASSRARSVTSSRSASTPAAGAGVANEPRFYLVVSEVGKYRHFFFPDTPYPGPRPEAVVYGQTKCPLSKVLVRTTGWVARHLRCKCSTIGSAEDRLRFASRWQTTQLARCFCWANSSSERCSIL